MNTTQHYDYTAEKRDDVDKIGFGKHKNWTPHELFIHEPKYMVWAWNKTQLWVGSESLVERAHKIVGETFKPRAEPTEVESRIAETLDEKKTVAEFEWTCLQTFGCSPYKAWQTA